MCKQSESEKRGPSAAKRAVPKKFSWKIAGPFINQFSVQPGYKIVIVCRVSTAAQKPHLGEQERFLRNAVEAAGGIVIDVVSWIGGGCEIHWLREAMRTAKSHDAKVLAESTARFIRDSSYHPVHYPYLQATLEDLGRLQKLADGVELMTYADPEALPDEIKSLESRRGQWAKKRKGGRPSKKLPGRLKDRRTKNLQQVLRLNNEGNLYQTEISRFVGVPRQTIQRWIKENA